MNDNRCRMLIFSMFLSGVYHQSIWIFSILGLLSLLNTKILVNSSTIDRNTPQQTIDNDHNQKTKSHQPTLPAVVCTWRFPQAAVEAWKAVISMKDAVESVVAGCSVCEDGSCAQSVGKGGSPDENGETTLDAMIMDGRTMDVGSVGCLREVQQAIAVAHAVMKYTKHTLLVGELASDFAVSMGFKRQSLQTKKSYQMWQNWTIDNCQPNYRQNVSPDPSKHCGPYSPDKSTYAHYTDTLHQTGHSPRYNEYVTEDNHDTIGMVVVDAEGNVASGTSTNGASHKVPGRVGDSPIAGAGSYAENGKGGAAATGDGDVMMRLLPSYHTVQLMGEGYPPEKAAQMAIARIVKFYPKHYGAVIAVNTRGEHGAACHNFSPFQYVAVNSSTGKADILNVNCTTSV